VQKGSGNIWHPDNKGTEVRGGQVGGVGGGMNKGGGGGGGCVGKKHLQVMLQLFDPAAEKELAQEHFLCPKITF